MRWILLFVLFSVLLQGEWKEVTEEEKNVIKVEVLPPRIDSVKAPPPLRYSWKKMIRRYAEVTGDWEKVRIDSLERFWHGRLDGMVKMADCIVKGTVVKVEHPSPDSIYNACAYLLVEKSFKGCKEEDTIKVKLAYPETLEFDKNGICKSWKFSDVFQMLEGKRYFLFLWRIPLSLLRCREREKSDTLLIKKIWEMGIVPDGYEPFPAWDWLVQDDSLIKLEGEADLMVHLESFDFKNLKQLESAIESSLSNNKEEK